MINIKDFNINVVNADIVGGYPHIVYASKELPSGPMDITDLLEAQAMHEARGVVCVAQNLDTPERLPDMYSGNAVDALCNAMSLVQRLDQRAGYAEGLADYQRSVLRLMFLRGMRLDDAAVQRQAAVAAQAVGEAGYAWRERCDAEEYLMYIEDRTGISFRNR